MFTTPLSSKHPATKWLEKHGDGVYDISFSVACDEEAYQSCLSRGAIGVDEPCVIENEFGSPTNAKDLALAILQIIPKLENIETEIYHYSNMGICSRLDLANAVNLIVNGKSNIISTNILESKLKRPKFSALNNSKFKNKFDIEIKNWKESLNDHFNELGITKYIFNEI